MLTPWILTVVLVSAGAPDGKCARCGWSPPQATDVIPARPGERLDRLARSLKPGGTLLLEDGEYILDAMVDLTARGVVLRGKSGDAAKVKLRGGGMTERRVGVGISVSAPDVTICDVTVSLVGYHGIQVRGERAASGTMIHGVHILDVGQQLIKGSAPRGGPYADNCTVACSTLEYTVAAPSDYTNGVDVLGGKGWVVRQSSIRRIRGPEGKPKAGPAILFWANSMDTRIEGNLIADCYRGIALGLGPGFNAALARDGEKKFDHQGGLVRNNVVVNQQAWADEAIEVNACPGARVEHNTVLVEGQLAWSISVRFAETSAVVVNNLTNRETGTRNGGKVDLKGNVSGARADWFVDVKGEDLRLAGPGRPAIDAGAPLLDVKTDRAGKPRQNGRAPDAGAHEADETRR